MSWREMICFTWSKGRVVSCLTDSTLRMCQPRSVLYGPPICPASSLNAASASSGCAPIEANCPSFVTVPRLPPLVRVSESTDQRLTRSSHFALGAFASIRTRFASASFLSRMWRTVTVAGTR